jgi:hypothetical protein
MQNSGPEANMDRIQFVPVIPGSGQVADFRGGRK